MPIRSLWSLPLQAAPAGLALAREKNAVLAWDRNHWLYHLDRGGKCQAQRHFPTAIRAACCADDGSAYAAVGAAGEVWWLAPDLMTRWEKGLPHAALAAAQDPLGQYLAVADDQGGLHLFDCLGRPVGQAQAARPLHHLIFVPELPLLIGCADYGLAAAFDVTGKVAWRVGLVANVGALAVSGDGELIVLACFSEGLLCYGRGGKALGRLDMPGACRLVSVSYDGRLILAGGLDGGLWLLDRDGRQLASYPLKTPAVTLALGALGRDAVLACADGPILRMGID
jgi:hypothetical protein